MPWNRRLTLELLPGNAAGLLGRADTEKLKHVGIFMEKMYRAATAFLAAVLPLASVMALTRQPTALRLANLLFEATDTETERKASVRALDWSSDGASILSLSHGYLRNRAPLAIHDMVHGAAAKDIVLSGIRAAAATLASDGRHILVGTFDGRLLWVDAMTAELHVLIEAGSAKELGTTCVSPDGKLAAAAAGDGDGEIYVCRTDGSQPGKRLGGNGSSSGSVQFSASGQRLLSAGSNGIIQYWDISRGCLVATLKGHIGPVVDAVLLPCEEQVLSAGLDGTVRLWDIQSGAELWTLRASAQGGISALALSSDGRWAAFGGYGAAIEVWDVAARSKLRDCFGHAAAVTCLRFSQNGKWLASGGLDGFLCVRDVATGAEVARIAAGGGRPPPKRVSL